MFARLTRATGLFEQSLIWISHIWRSTSCSHETESLWLSHDR